MVPKRLDTDPGTLLSGCVPEERCAAVGRVMSSGPSYAGEADGNCCTPELCPLHGQGVSQDWLQESMEHKFSGWQYKQTSQKPWDTIFIATGQILYS